MKVSVLSPVIFIAAIAMLLSGCATTVGAPTTQNPSGITIGQAWARPSSLMASGSMGSMEMLTSAAYLTIRNGGPADRLTAAEGDIAKTIEVHQTTMAAGIAKMEMVKAIDIPVNGSVDLKPGGYHIMLIQPVRELKPGDTFSLTLVFEKAGRKQVPITVQAQAPS